MTIKAFCCSYRHLLHLSLLLSTGCSPSDLGFLPLTAVGKAVHLSGIAGTDVTVRSRPSRNSGPMGLIKSGTVFEITRKKGEWYGIRLPGNSTGYIPATDVHLFSGTGRQVSAPISKYLPGQAEILKRTGWFDFVDGSTDVILYHPYQQFTINGEPAWGYAEVVGRQRTAHIATGGHSARLILGVIVHEAAHLSGIASTHQMLSQDDAYSIETHFLVQLDETFPKLRTTDAAGIGPLISSH